MSHPKTPVQTTPATARRGGRKQLGSGTATSLPVYHQLHLVLGQRIREGIYGAGSRFPSEFALASTFNVSRVSVRRALAQLEADGLIDRRRGSGTFVADLQQSAIAPISGEIDNLITIGMETETRLISCGLTRDAPPQAHAALDVVQGEDLFAIERLRLHKGEPFSLTNIYLRPQEAALIDLETLGAQPVITALEKAGMRSSTAEQTIGATLADDQSAGKLAVPLGSALVRLRRAVLRMDGGTLLFQQSLYRPDRYEYHMLLTRERSMGQPRWRHIG